MQGAPPAAPQMEAEPSKPKQTRRKKSRMGRLPSDISREELAQWFHLPAEEAARVMRVSLTVLKRVARKHGVLRWPYRKVKSLTRALSQTGGSTPATPHASQLGGTPLSSTMSEPIGLLQPSASGQVGGLSPSQSQLLLDQQVAAAAAAAAAQQMAGQGPGSPRLAPRQQHSGLQLGMQMSSSSLPYLPQQQHQQQHQQQQHHQQHHQRLPHNLSASHLSGLAQPTAAPPALPGAPGGLAPPPSWPQLFPRQQQQPASPHTDPGYAGGWQAVPSPSGASQESRLWSDPSAVAVAAVQHPQMHHTHHQQQQALPGRSSAPSSPRAPRVVSLVRPMPQHWQPWHALAAQQREKLPPLAEASQHQAPPPLRMPAEPGAAARAARGADAPPLLAASGARTPADSTTNLTPTSADTRGIEVLLSAIEKEQQREQQQSHPLTDAAAGSGALAAGLTASTRGVAVSEEVAAPPRPAASTEVVQEQQQAGRFMQREAGQGSGRGAAPGMARGPLDNLDSEGGSAGSSSDPPTTNKSSRQATPGASSAPSDAIASNPAQPAVLVANPTVPPQQPHLGRPRFGGGAFRPLSPAEAAAANTDDPAAAPAPPTSPTAEAAAASAGMWQAAAAAAAAAAIGVTRPPHPPRRAVGPSPLRGSPVPPASPATSQHSKGPFGVELSLQDLMAQQKAGAAAAGGATEQPSLAPQRTSLGTSGGRAGAAPSPHLPLGRDFSFGPAPAGAGDDAARAGSPGPERGSGGSSPEGALAVKLATAVGAKRPALWNNWELGGGGSPTKRLHLAATAPAIAAAAAAAGGAVDGAAAAQPAVTRAPAAAEAECQRCQLPQPPAHVSNQPQNPLPQQPLQQLLSQQHSTALAAQAQAQATLGLGGGSQGIGSGSLVLGSGALGSGGLLSGSDSTSGELNMQAVMSLLRQAAGMQAPPQEQQWEEEHRQLLGMLMAAGGGGGGSASGVEALLRSSSWERQQRAAAAAAAATAAPAAQQPAHSQHFMGGASSVPPTLLAQLLGGRTASPRGQGGPGAAFNPFQSSHSAPAALLHLTQQQPQQQQHPGQPAAAAAASSEPTKRSPSQLQLQQLAMQHAAAQQAQQTQQAASAIPEQVALFCLQKYANKLGFSIDNIALQQAQQQAQQQQSQQQAAAAHQALLRQQAQEEHFLLMQQAQQEQALLLHQAQQEQLLLQQAAAQEQARRLQHAAAAAKQHASHPLRNHQHQPPVKPPQSPVG